MTRSLTVAILDDDPYFVQGLTALLHPLITGRYDTLRVVGAARATRANLVFQGRGAPACGAGYRGWTIRIREAGPVHRGPMAACPRIQGEIPRRGTLERVLREVARVLVLPPPERDETFCLACHQLLSWRERQVLSHLAVGCGVSQVAQRLALSVKTVSGYKCRAMYKLGFTRSIELYRWLLAGGLAHDGDMPD
ncbi:response regulator transcription factor [Serratia marcescens]|uniref:response regulator transcription factor n=1 Tax=Serratia marcescens TaxID=615 RepID=UPI0007C90539|nr:helix-turn-helix transcriptional regulator [Serratia marcescens]OAH32774.1 hypothetical protein AYJ10_18730 [Serratia marcescens]